MPAPVVLVHDDPAFLSRVETAFRTAGMKPATFHSSMVALATLEKAVTVRVLVTRDNFNALHDPNGVSLTLITRHRIPDLKAVFVCSNRTEQLVADYGVALNGWADPAAIVKSVQELLG
jgi:hypothetical protein